MPLKVLGVIPARWASSRFEGKPLAEIAGKPMIAHVCERVRLAQQLDSYLVATDDDRIADFCKSNGFPVAMTSPDHRTGTDRLAEVAETHDAEIYVNIQGDEPLIDPAAIDAVADVLLQNRHRNIEVSTAYIEGATEAQEQSLNYAHLVPTMDGCVLTFSRLPVPAAFRDPAKRTIHVGLYAFTGPALEAFAEWEQGPVERAESIELMRFLERGWRIACVPIEPGSISVDHPEDVALVEARLGA